MAIFTPGPLVSALSGTIRSLAFRLGRNADIAAAAPSVSPTPTAALLAHQARYSILVNAWLALSFSSRAQWTAAAATYIRPNRLGIRRRLTAFTLFMKINLAPWVDATSPIIVPPVPLQVAAKLASGISFSAGGPYNLTFTDTLSQNPSHVEIYMRPLYRLRKPRPLGPMRYIASVPIDGVSHNIFTPFTAVWPELFSGQWAAFRWLLSEQDGSFPGGFGFLQEGAETFIP